jgi:hypothetical protein
MTAALLGHPRLDRSAWLGRLSGATAIGSGLAGIAWAAGLAPSDAFPELWITIWNLLLVPVAGWLALSLIRRSASGSRPGIAAIAGVAGIASCLLWATSRQRADLEAIWVGLSALWWLASGALLVTRGARAIGLLTLVVGGFAAIDSAMTALGVGGELYLLAGPKLPLGWVWALAIGVRLVADPLLDPDSR